MRKRCIDRRGKNEIAKAGKMIRLKEEKEMLNKDVGRRTGEVACDCVCALFVLWIMASGSHSMRREVWHRTGNASSFLLPIKSMIYVSSRCLIRITWLSTCALYTDYFYCD